MPLRKEVKHPWASFTPFLLAWAMSSVHSETVTADSTNAPGRNIVIVRSDRNNGFIQSIVGTGTLRSASIMDVPAIVNTVTSDVIDRQGATSLCDVQCNIAGVTRPSRTAAPPSISGSCAASRSTTAA